MVAFQLPGPYLVKDNASLHIMRNVGYSRQSVSCRRLAGSTAAHLAIRVCQEAQAGVKG